jgi:hypothetical protein
MLSPDIFHKHFPSSLDLPWKRHFYSATWIWVKNAKTDILAEKNEHNIGILENVCDTAMIRNSISVP